MNSGLNYSALTYDELACMATTDDGARQYLADNAADIIEDFEDYESEYIMGAISDAHRDGEDEGSNEERKNFRELFGTEIRALYTRLSKSKGELTPLRSDCKDLLEALVDEYSIK